MSSGNHLSIDWLKEYSLQGSLYEDSVLNAYDLLYGRCVDTSVLIAQLMQDLEALYVRVDKAFLVGTKGPILHQYCVVNNQGRDFYLDVRGVFTDYQEFIKPFISDVKDFFNIRIANVFDYDTDYDMEFQNIVFDEDNQELVDLVHQLFIRDNFAHMCAETIKQPDLGL